MTVDNNEDEVFDGQDHKAKLSSASASTAGKSTKTKVASLVRQIWTEFYSCGDPSKCGPEGQCEACCSDGDTDKPISSAAKCHAIPPLITFFCQEMQLQAKDKFPAWADSCVAEFLLNRWLGKEMCEDGNLNGLIPDLVVRSALKRNLTLAKEALEGLLGGSRDF